MKNKCRICAKQYFCKGENCKQIKFSEASRQTKINTVIISYSANKKRKTGGGYIWEFA